MNKNKAVPIFELNEDEITLIETFRLLNSEGRLMVMAKAYGEKNRLSRQKKPQKVIYINRQCSEPLK